MGLQYYTESKEQRGQVTVSVGPVFAIAFMQILEVSCALCLTKFYL